MRNIDDLFQVMDKLLSPEGCPWDREQTPQTLAPFAIEEAHELAEALGEKNLDNIKEELGDLLFQVVFHSGLAKRLGQFEFGDVIESITGKLIRRHPHVFSDAKVKDSDEVLKNWALIKNKEKEEKGNAVEGEFNIPKTLPALQRAQKIGDKTKQLKFDWQTPSEVFEKVKEEMNELTEAFRSKDEVHTKEELGDLFFVLAQFARHMKFEAETVAREANKKFEDRFKKLLAFAKSEGKEFSNLTLDEKEELWEKVKSKNIVK